MAAENQGQRTDTASICDANTIRALEWRGLITAAPKSHDLLPLVWRAVNKTPKKVNLTRCRASSSIFLTRFDVLVELHSIIRIHVDKVDTIADIRKLGSHYRRSTNTLLV
jgi:hypothetical protein